MKPANILYFINGPVPTEEDRKAATEIQAKVMFRNAQHVPSEPHSLEICDGVAGSVPELYKEQFQDWKEALSAKKAEHKKVAGSDAAAPKAPADAKGQQPWKPN